MSCNERPVVRVNGRYMDELRWDISFVVTSLSIESKETKDVWALGTGTGLLFNFINCELLNEGD